MTETSASERGTKKINRSPSFPGIHLELALQRARAVWEHEKRNAAPVATIQEHWGFKPNSGQANLSLAALIKFGLLEDEGARDRRQARLTPLALHIVLADEDPAPLIRQAALTPPIHRELWERHQGSLPSDAALRRYLIIDRNFTPAGATDFISQFRKTIAFARLDESDPSSGPPAGAETPSTDQSQSEERSQPVNPTPPVQPPAVPPTPPGSATYAIPLVGAPPVHVTGPFPLTEAAWEHFIRVLEAMKPALIDQPSTE